MWCIAAVESLSEEYGFDRYEYLSRHGSQNCLVYHISPHHAIIKMPIIWSKIFLDWKNISVLASKHMVSLLLQDIAENGYRMTIIGIGNYHECLTLRYSREY